MDGSLFERGKALEDQFFGEKDRQLLEQLRQELLEKESREALMTVSGITDANVLDALIENSVTAETMTSLSLIPLVAVAWANGFVENNERDAILNASKSIGIEANSASQKLIESWLSQKPPEQLLHSWKDYIGSLKSSLDTTSLSQLKTSVVGRAKQVAEAAGGFLGIGKTSDKEAAVIEDLENSFD